MVLALDLQTFVQEICMHAESREQRYQQPHCAILELQPSTQAQTVHCRYVQHPALRWRHLHWHLLRWHPHQSDTPHSRCACSLTLWISQELHLHVSREQAGAARLLPLLLLHYIVVSERGVGSDGAVNDRADGT